MFTFGLLYVFLYLLTFLGLLILIFAQLPVYFLTHLSLTNFLVFLQKYVPTKNLFFFLIFSLTGLPPVGLFFVKFNILVYIIYQTHIFAMLILFLMFFLNMVYYIQLFNFKNFKKPVYHVLTPSLFQVWAASRFFGIASTYNTYKSILTVVNILLLLLLTLIIFADYFLIISIF